MDYIKVVLLTIAAYSISIMSFAGEPPAGCVEGTSTDLTTEGPKYAAIGVTHQYKGDYPFSIPPIDEYVDFLIVRLAMWVRIKQILIATHIIACLSHHQLED